MGALLSNSTFLVAVVGAASALLAALITASVARLNHRADHERALKENDASTALTALGLLVETQANQISNLNARLDALEASATRTANRHRRLQERYSTALTYSLVLSEHLRGMGVEAVGRLAPPTLIADDIRQNNYLEEA